MTIHSNPVFITIALLLSGICFCTGCSRQSAEDKKFAKLSDEFLEYYLEAHPVSATWIGEHRFDAEIDDLSREARDSEISRLNGFTARLGGIDGGKLSRDNRIDAQILENKIQKMLFSMSDLKEWEKNPLVYTRLFSNSIYLLIARDFAPLEDRLKSAVKRLEKFPAAVDQVIANLSNPPRVHTETAISQNRGTISLLDRDFRSEASKVPAMKEEVDRALDPALGALRRFQDFLEKDLFYRSNGEFRLGDMLYRRKLELTLMSRMGSEEIVEKAKADMERLHDEMFELASPLYAEMFPGGPVEAESRERRKEIVKSVLDEISRDHTSPDRLLEACKEAFEEASSFVRSKKIVPLPDDPLEIIWAPEFSRGVAVAGLRPPGPMDKGMKAFYVVSPPPEEWGRAQVESYLREYNSEMIRVLTIHEAMPGHYVQSAYANRFPSMLRAVFPSGTFVEGWAVYSERVMLDEGFRDGDPRLALQRKKFFLRAVVNALLDADIHRGGISEYEALKLMIEDGFQEESEARGKWRRACLTSTQLSTYYVGYKDVALLRRDVEDRRGGGFDLGDFHKELLSHGSPPVKFLREILMED